MSWYKRVNETGNADDFFQNVEGRSGCCGDDVTIDTYSNAAEDIGATPITGINIDGTDYTFTVAANTLPLLYAGVNESMKAAGYSDIDDAGTVVSGAAATAVVTIKTSAVLTQLNNGGAGVALTAA